MEQCVISRMEWMDYTTMDTFMDRMLSIMPQALEDQGSKLVFCMATRYEPNPDPASDEKVVPTGTYILY